MPYPRAMTTLLPYDPTQHARLLAQRTLLGAIPGPMESWLTLRGMRTLHLRVERASANAAEIAALAGQGLTYLQLDDTSLAYLNDPRQRAELVERGEDADAQHLRYIRTINAALAGKPDGLHVTTHLCRGNFRSSWAAEGSYDFVAEALFGELAVDGFFLEYDDDRSGDFRPLRFLPKGKIVVLGLVTTKFGQMESKDDLKRRIGEAAQYVSLDQLCLSPQCGFSSTVHGNNIAVEDQRRKLALVVEVAREVWG